MNTVNEAAIPAIKFHHAGDCFDHAITMGRLSVHKSLENYAGKYMYMGTWGDKDQFKNSVTREYLA